MATVSLRNICKSYQNGVEAVKNFNLTIEDKEFIIIVGPSGCGKSTLLRMIAGIEEITSGELLIGDKSMEKIPAKDRNIAMVFQNYALFPHLNVYENIAFGLRARKTPKKEIAEIVMDAANTLGISHLLKRKPKQLSGGERQRVAMGRAIVRNPSVFLMDEPLSNLDALLRVQMRSELSLLHKRLGNTFIYVTHDQTEAMTLCNRMVVMKDGEIQQVGSPKEIYHHPANQFVAGFIGAPQMNFLRNENGDTKSILGVRPEDVLLCEKNDEDAKGVTVLLTELLGQEILLYLDKDGEKIIARVQSDCEVEADDFIYIKFNKNKIHYFDAITGKRIEKKYNN